LAQAGFPKCPYIERPQTAQRNLTAAQESKSSKRTASSLGSED